MDETAQNIEGPCGGLAYHTDGLAQLGQALVLWGPVSPGIPSSVSGVSILVWEPPCSFLGSVKTAVYSRGPKTRPPSPTPRVVIPSLPLLPLRSS